MKTVIGVIAALLTLGIAALGLLTAQRLSSPPDRVAGLPSRDLGTGATTRPLVATTPSVAAATPGASASALAFSAPPPVASEQASPSNRSGLTEVTNDR